MFYVFVILLKNKFLPKKIQITDNFDAILKYADF